MHGIKVTGVDDDYILKGSEINRIANSKEPLDSKRKYVSLTKEDKRTYGEMFDMLGIDMSKPISDYVYEAKRDLRIASGKKICDDIIEKYGDQHIKDIHKLVRDDYGKSIDSDFDDYDTERNETRRFIRDQIKKHEDEIITNYSSKNYDGIVDPEDWISGLAEYPVILLNPKNSVSLKSELSWEDKYKK